LIEYGIKDSMDFYTKLMQDNELSEEIHQAVLNCLVIMTDYGVDEVFWVVIIQ
jgi:hypothetical protein